MIGGSQAINRNGRLSAQAVRDHQDLIVNLIVQLHLGLRVILCIFFQEFHLESVDPAVIVHMIEKGFYAICQRNADDVHRPGIRRQNTQGNCFGAEINTGACLDSSRTRARTAVGATGKNEQGCQQEKYATR